MLDLTNQFLVATTELDGTLFERSVVYICQHDQNGAMGIIVNQPLGPKVFDIMRQLDIDAKKQASASQQFVLCGGPVQVEHGFVLHHPIGSWGASMTVTDSMALTTSKDILEAMAKGEGPEDCLVALGHAGWDEDQLEEELTENAWIVAPASIDVLFHTPTKKRWEKALALSGIQSPFLLSNQIGHA